MDDIPDLKFNVRGLLRDPDTVWNFHNIPPSYDEEDVFNTPLHHANTLVVDFKSALVELNVIKVFESDGGVLPHITLYVMALDENNEVTERVIVNISNGEFDVRNNFASVTKVAIAVVASDSPNVAIRIKLFGCLSPGIIQKWFMFGMDNTWNNPEFI